jgi:hypothetical protein
MKPTEFIIETSQIAQEADNMHADHEVQMARSDCYSAAKYAIELHRMLKEVSEQQGLDGWVSEKITLANDYLRSVHEYLSHEMAHGQEQAMMGFTAEAAEYAFDKMLSEVDQKTMSRAAKGYEKYGKKGMQALAKAGREGKDLTKIRDKYNKYDKGVSEVAMSPAPTPQKSGIPSDATTTVPGMKATPADLKKANSSAVIGEMATGGGSSSGGIATSMGGPGHKSTSGIPKKVSNAHKSKKIAVGKGVY